MYKALLAGVAALAISTVAGAQTFAIQAGHLIVDAAQPERGASTVVVENGRISRIDNGFTTPQGAIVVDQRTRTVLPGMTDVHVHLTQTSGTPWYMAAPLYCTRTASRLVRTYTDRHGLKDLVKELLNIDLSKAQQTSNWGASEISEAQREYAASDVRYLHALKEKLDERLKREDRLALAQACFDFLPARAMLDIAGWPEEDILAHNG